MSKRDERHQARMATLEKDVSGNALPRPTSPSSSLGGLPVTELLRDTARKQQAELEEARRELAEANAKLKQKGDPGIDTAEVQRLRETVARLEAATVVQALDPSRVRHSRFRDRHELGFADAKFKQLKADIARDGKVTVPVKVRPVDDDPDADHEIVFGHRRQRVCLELGLALPAIVAEMSDRDVLLEMHRENAERESLSAFEEAHKLARMLAEGVFPDQASMGKALGLSQSAISKQLSLASLPDDIVSMFRDPREITKHHGQQLRAAMGKPTLLARLRAATKDGPVAAKVITSLLAPVDRPKSLEGHGTQGTQIVGHFNGAGMQLLIERHLDQGQMDRLAKFLEQL